LLDELTSTQLSEWIAYDKIDPLGDWREDYRFSFLSSLITNLAIRTHGEKGAKLTTVEDFMFVWDPAEMEDKKEQGIEEMKKLLLSFAPKKEPRKMRNKKEKK